MKTGKVSTIRTFVDRHVVSLTIAGLLLIGIASLQLRFYGHRDTVSQSNGTSLMHHLLADR